MFSLAWNTIFTGYWEVLVLDFSEIGNTYCLFWARKLMERWYLLIAEKFLLFWTFLRWKIRSLWAKKLMERWYLLITEKFLFWTIWRWEMRSFFELKIWRKDDIYLLSLWKAERSVSIVQVILKLFAELVRSRSIQKGKLIFL